MGFFEAHLEQAAWEWVLDWWVRALPQTTGNVAQAELNFCLDPSLSTLVLGFYIWL